MLHEGLVGRFQLTKQAIRGEQTEPNTSVLARPIDARCLLLTWWVVSTDIGVRKKVEPPTAACGVTDGLGSVRTGSTQCTYY